MSGTQWAMAGPLKLLTNTFQRWWMGQKDNHFRIVSSLTILSLAATICILFLFVLGGTTDDSKEMWVPWSWLGLIVGGALAFWMVPEFMVYLGHKAALDEILLLIHGQRFSGGVRRRRRPQICLGQATNPIL